MPPRRRRDLPLAQALLAPAPPPAALGSRPSSPLAAKTEPEIITLPPLFAHSPPPASSPSDPTDASAPPTAEDQPEATLADLHARIYHIVALALRAYIQQWYTRLSRDPSLLPAITADIVAPIARTLALDRQRIHTLLLVHLPTILATHIRTLASAESASIAGLGPIPEAYHARLPLRSVAPAPAPISSHGDTEFALSPTYLTALADALLAHALPAHEYDADAQRLIVREVVARPVFGSIGRRLAAPWFWAELLLKHLDKPSPSPSPPAPTQGLPANLGARAAHALDALLCLWARALTLLTLLWNASIFLVAAWSGSPPPTTSRILDPWLALVNEIALFLAPVPPLGLRLVLGAVSVAGTLLGPAADRLAPYLLDMVLTPTTGVRIVALLERILFPNGWPGPPPIEPSADEADVLHERLREVLRRRGKAAGRLGMDAGRGAEVLGDGGCNAHLVGMVLDAIVLAIVPELAAESEQHEPEREPEQEKLLTADHAVQADAKPTIEHRTTPEITVQAP